MQCNNIERKMKHNSLNLYNSIRIHLIRRHVSCALMVLFRQSNLRQLSNIKEEWKDAMNGIYYLISRLIHTRCIQMMCIDVSRNSLCGYTILMLFRRECSKCIDCSMFALSEKNPWHPQMTRASYTIASTK